MMMASATAAPAEDGKNNQMKTFSYETKRDGYEVKYIVKAETKEEATKKIEKISGERGIRVKEV